MIANFSSSMSNEYSLPWLDTEPKDRTIYVDPNWSTPLQDSEISGDVSTLNLPDADDVRHYDPISMQPLFSDNGELLEEEGSVKTQPRPEPLSKGVYGDTFNMHKQKQEVSRCVKFKFLLILIGKPCSI